MGGVLCRIVIIFIDPLPCIKARVTVYLTVHTATFLVAGETHTPHIM